jgi:hypothetical protein
MLHEKSPKWIDGPDYIEIQKRVNVGDNPQKAEAF